MLPRLYNDLSHLWHLVSPPADYVDEARSFSDQFSRLGVPDGASLLHLGCGGGSIDFHLKKTYQLTGVDLSDKMIGVAKSLNPEVRYQVNDMRSARLGVIFDAVLIHDAIAYMTSTSELEDTYRTAAAHLRSGGALISLPEEIRSRLAPHRVTSETHSDGVTTLTLIEVDHDEDPGDHWYESVYLYLIREGRNVRVEMDRHTVGVFEVHEFLDAVKAAGFEAELIEWNLPSWQDDEIPMPLIVARKI